MRLYEVNTVRFPFDPEFERIIHDAMLIFLDNARKNKKECPTCKCSFEVVDNVLVAKVVNRLHFFCTHCGTYHTSMIIGEKPPVTSTAISETETQKFKELLSTPQSFESQFYAYAKQKGVSP